jgi:myo-inositol-1(or 4)-monophosphatase
VREATADLVGTETGRAELSQGAGGDTTVEIDRLAESVALDRLAQAAAAGAKFSILSEEVGQRSHGANWPLVLIDPIDGSLNAKQGIPVFAVMLALLDGPTLGDTRVGHVLNLATGDTWHAVRGVGAYRNQQDLTVLPMHRGRRDFEMVALESSPRSVIRAQPLLERSAKVRVLGSMALSIVHTATGGVDVFCAPFQARAFDMAASLLILREAGGTASDCDGADVYRVPAALDGRTSLLCASDAEYHRQALQVMRGALG